MISFANTKIANAVQWAIDRFSRHGALSRSFSSAMANEVKNDIDFMLQFGNLRAAFLDAIKDADAKMLQTGIVVKIARLCREHSKLLTDNEKQTCTSIIDEMKSTLKKVNPDTFMDGVLQEARIAVAK